MEVDASERASAMRRVDQGGPRWTLSSPATPASHEGAAGKIRAGGNVHPRPPTSTLLLVFPASEPVLILGPLAG